MAVETEKKYRLNAGEKDFVTEALKNIQAVYNGEDFEENIIYGGGILTEQKSILRVRKTREKTILTYKRRIENSQSVKRQLEYETEFENAEELSNIIENLGFTSQLIYEKRRQTWHFKTVEIVLDELPFGQFMEIEGTESAISETEKELGIEHFSTEHETYPHLTKKHGKLRGTTVEARF